MIRDRALMTCWSILQLAVFVSAAFVTETAGPHDGVPPMVPTNLDTVRNVREGDDLRLVCEAQSQSQLLVEWYKDGKVIDATWRRFRQMNNDLKIKNVRKSDAGNYRCQAVNGFGQISITYTLNVIDPNDPYSQNDQEQKPQFTNLKLIQDMSQMPLAQTIGSNLQLQCAAKGNPTPSIEWYKNGQKIKESWNQHGEDWTLELKNLQSDDAGQYSCRVANIFGRINASFYVTVQESADVPEWLGNPVNISILEGQTATFQCKVRSSIPPTIQWLRRIDDPNQAPAAAPDTIISLMGRNYTILGKPDDRKPEQEPGTEFWHNQLVLQNVRRDHEGWYICVVHNLYHGQVTHKEAFLRIQPSKVKHEPLIDESAIPLQYVVGIPVGILLLIIVAYAVWFLVKNQQKQDPLSNNNSRLSSGVYGRPPPPPFTPPNPSYGKSTPSYKSHYKAYQHLDPQAAVPLTNGHAFHAPSDRDIYEATPQPYELNFSAHDFSDSYSDLSAPRMQHYPSMYSCNR